MPSPNTGRSLSICRRRRSTTSTHLQGPYPRPLSCLTLRARLGRNSHVSAAPLLQLVQKGDGKQACAVRERRAVRCRPAAVGRLRPGRATRWDEHLRRQGRLHTLVSSGRPQHVRRAARDRATGVFRHPNRFCGVPSKKQSQKRQMSMESGRYSACSPVGPWREC